MSATLSTNTFAQWHHCLGHPLGSWQSTLVGCGILGPAYGGNALYCIGCKLGKQLISSESTFQHPFDLIHFDVWDHAPFISKGVTPIIWSLLIIFEIHLDLFDVFSWSNSFRITKVCYYVPHLGRFPFHADSAGEYISNAHQCYLAT
jgi:hypothetical protein